MKKKSYFLASLVLLAGSAFADPTGNSAQVPYGTSPYTTLASWPNSSVGTIATLIYTNQYGQQTGAYTNWRWNGSSWVMVEQGYSPALDQTSGTGSGSGTGGDPGTGGGGGGGGGGISPPSGCYGACTPVVTVGAPKAT